jgi:hypothetical protein
MITSRRRRRRRRWRTEAARIGEMGNAYKIFVEKPEGKRPLRRRWEDNIKMDLI